MGVVKPAVSNCSRDYGLFSPCISFFTLSLDCRLSKGRFRENVWKFPNESVDESLSFPRIVPEAKSKGGRRRVKREGKSYYDEGGKGQ